MELLKLNSWRTAFYCFLIILVSGCSVDEDSQPPTSGKSTKNWKDGVGSAVAENVTLKFKNINFKSASELHFYKASIKDRVVEGTFEVQNFDLEGKPVSDAKGDVICIVFGEDCKTVRMTGIITAGSDPVFIGFYAIWTAMDIGEGTDKTTDIRYPVDQTTANFHCETGWTIERFGFKSFLSTPGIVKVESKDC